MKRLFAALVCLLGCCLLLCGCSKTVTKDQILEDIRDKDYVYDEYDLTVTDYSESRPENRKDKDTQIIEVTVTAENDIFEYTCSYELRYVRYDDGWRLKGYGDDIIETVAKEEPDTDDVEADFRDYFRQMLDDYDLTEEHFGKVKLMDDELSLTSFIPCRLYRVSFTGSNDMLQLDAQLELCYQLDHEDGWVLTADKFGYNKAETQVTVLASADDALADYMAEEGMESYEVLSVTERDAFHLDYLIRAVDSDGSKYVSRTVEYDLTCVFTDETGWFVFGSPDRELVAAEFDTTGYWLYDDGTGENIYEINVYKMTADSITMSYDITIKSVYDDEVRYVSSDGIVTMGLGVKSAELDEISLVSEYNVAGPEGKGAGSYKLRFFSYTGADFDKSGFSIDGYLLKKVT